MGDEKEKIDLARYLAGLRSQRGGRSATENESRQARPERETRPQSEKENFPDYYDREQRKKQEKSWERGGRG